MIFLSLIVVLALVQWWGSGAPLQYDVWYLRWLNVIQNRFTLNHFPLLGLVLAVFLPAVLMGFIAWVITSFLSANWLFFIYVPVLLYSLGRGNFSSEVKAYLAASERGDSVVAARLSDTLLGNAATVRDTEQVDDWAALHAQTLRVIAYRSFERMFAVLFWFFVLGAVGALAYRLSVLYREYPTENSAHERIAAKWLWVMEWPAVRIMGLTWALVGNFDSCFSCWQKQLPDTKNSSMILLNDHLRGALGIEQAHELGSTENGIPSIKPNEPAYSLSLIKASLSLFSRSLLLWVSVIAVITLLL